MTAANTQLRDLGTPLRDAEQTELHPDLNRAHVRFINLGKTYDGTVHALQGTDLALQHGQVVRIIGRNRAGSSCAARPHPRPAQPRRAPVRAATEAIAP